MKVWDSYDTLDKQFDNNTFWDNTEMNQAKFLLQSPRGKKRLETNS